MLARAASAAILVVLGAVLLAGDPAGTLDTAPVLVEPIRRADREAAVALRAKLDQPLSDFSVAEGTTLRKALMELAERIEADLVIEERALEDVGILVDDVAPRIDIRRAPVSARTILSLLLQDSELLVHTNFGVIFISTWDWSKQRIEVRLYEVDDLLEGVTPQRLPMPGGSSGIPLPEDYRFSAESQLTALLHRMTTGPWFDQDGTGGDMDIYDGVLAVRHSEQMHAEVEAVLSALREVRQRRPAKVPEEP